MLKVIDFFCGAGGLTRGLLDSGIAVLAGIDSDERLQRTYEVNNKPSKFLARDIRQVNIGELRSELGIDTSDLVLYAACTPCQPFSTLNQMKGADDRKNLLLDFATIVRESPPDFVLVENVPGLNTAYGRDIYEAFIGERSERETQTRRISRNFERAQEDLRRHGLAPGDTMGRSSSLGPVEGRQPLELAPGQLSPQGGQRWPTPRRQRLSVRCFASIG